jgi:hypothetical protein
MVSRHMPMRAARGSVLRTAARSTDCLTDDRSPPTAPHQRPLAGPTDDPRRSRPGTCRLSLGLYIAAGGHALHTPTSSQGSVIKKDKEWWAEQIEAQLCDSGCHGKRL